MCVKLIKQPIKFPMLDDSNDRALKNRVMKYIKLDLLDLDTLIPKLNKYHLLTQTNLYDLKNRLVPPTKRANALVYQILPSKGVGAFTLFVKCLQEEKEHMGHQTLARLFTLPDQVPETSPVQCEDKESIGKLRSCANYALSIVCTYVLITC